MKVSQTVDGETIESQTVEGETERSFHDERATTFSLTTSVTSVWRSLLYAGFDSSLVGENLSQQARKIQCGTNRRPFLWEKEWAPQRLLRFHWRVRTA